MNNHSGNVNVAFVSDDINSHVTINNLDHTKVEDTKIPETTHNNHHDTVIKLENVFYSYGKNEVLKGIDMNVKRGTIYGLIGASGCGKTTTLRMIIGIVKPSSGIVTTFSNTPGVSLSAIPGPGVGYMPQELALHEFLNINETLYFYARLNKVEYETQRNRIDELIRLLHLPKGNRLVSGLSGGQKRRVSLAAALIHEPPLLILDEPTVGVDPILRHNIWEHLRNICMKNNQTIIITTHYHEEAKSSDCIGLMRNGRLLIEENPTKILTQMNLPSIEDVFLKLSLNEDLKTDHNEKKRFSLKSLSFDRNIKKIESYLKRRRSTESNTINVNYRSNSIIENILKGRNRPITKVSALVWKNAISFKRNIPAFIAQFVFPIIQTLLAVSCLGNNPKNLNIGVYNSDTSVVSHLILYHINPESINLKYYDSLANAINGVKIGQTWGVMSFPANYTIALQEFAHQFSCDCTDDENMTDISGYTIQFPQIELFMDETNLIISAFIKAQIMLAIKETSKYSDEIFGKSVSLSNLELSPVKFSEPPIYGHPNIEMTAFIVPGMILTLSFFTALAMTGIGLFTERKDGILERSLASGVKPYQFILSIFVLQLIILSFQIAFVMLAVYNVFDVPQHGSYLLVHALSFIQGLCGMSFGLLMASVCKTESEALVFSSAAMLPIMMLSGTMWPPQSLPKYVLYVSYVLPLYFAGEAIRSITGRGWDLSYPIVQMGFAVSGIWVIILFIAAAYFFKKAF